MFCELPDGTFEFWPHIGIWRVMWRGKSERVMLNGHLPRARELAVFPEGTILEVQGGLCGSSGDPREYMEGKTIVRFSDCTVRNRWINRLSVLHPDYKSVVNIFIELNCKIELVLDENIRT